MDFHVGSGLAALTEIGNVGQNLRFYGGRYGILTSNTSPFWPYTLIDSVFDGQREAAIREHMAGLTLVRTTFRNVPVGISIDRDYSDQLWLKDARFENVSTAALVIDKEQNPTTQIGVADAVCCERAGVCAIPGERADARRRRRERIGWRGFHHGVFVRGAETHGLGRERFRRPTPARPARRPCRRPSVRCRRPSSGSTCARSASKATARPTTPKPSRRPSSAHRVLYFPTGFYIVRDTHQR